MIVAGLLIVIIFFGIIIFIAIKKHIDEKNTVSIINLSESYKKIKEINKKTTFFQINKSDFNFNQYFKSKRSLEKFDEIKFLKKVISEKYNYYIELLNKININKKLYKEYTQEFSNAKKIDSYYIMEMNKIFISKKKFMKIEDELCNKLKKQVPYSPYKIHIYCEYTSPTGRSSWNREIDIQLLEFENLIKIVGREMSAKILSEHIKEIAKQKKQEKERKLRELNKIEKSLNKREEVLQAKVEEFNEATKGHIYSREFIDTDLKESEIDFLNLSLSEKLKYYKKQFDEGLLTYDQYRKKREELF